MLPKVHLPGTIPFKDGFLCTPDHRKKFLLYFFLQVKLLQKGAVFIVQKN